MRTCGCGSICGALCPVSWSFQRSTLPSGSRTRSNAPTTALYRVWHGAELSTKILLALLARSLRPTRLASSPLPSTHRCNERNSCPSSLGNHLEAIPRRQIPQAELAARVCPDNVHGCSRSAYVPRKYDTWREDFVTPLQCMEHREFIFLGGKYRGYL